MHSFSTTLANVHDVSRGPSTIVRWGAASVGDAGLHRSAEAGSEPGTGGGVAVAMKPSQRRKLDPESPVALMERVKSSIRAESLSSTVIGSGTPLLGREADIRVHQEPAPEPHRGSATGAWPRTWNG